MVQITFQEKSKKKLFNLSETSLQLRAKVQSKRSHLNVQTSGYMLVHTR